MKNYTDLEQSKRLAEILPLESADMWYWHFPTAPTYNNYDYPMFHKGEDICNVPCLSLAALIGALPKEINVLGTIYSINIHTKNEKWFIDYKCNNEEFVGVHSNIFVDACYEMILKLNELNLL